MGCFCKNQSRVQVGCRVCYPMPLCSDGCSTFMLNGISGGIKVVGGVQELHLRASMRFMGVKLSVSVDVNFSEIGHFIAAIVAALIEVIHKKLFSFGCNLSIEAEYLD